jgi:hypothetical protein
MNSAWSRVWLRVLLGATVVTALGALAWGVSRHPAPPPAQPADEIAPSSRGPSNPAPSQTPKPRPPVSPVPARAATGADENKAMAEIRSQVSANPDRAIALIDAADKAHPTGAFTEERLALRIDALVNVGRIGAARDSAEQYLVRVPKGSAAEHIERLTGVHPRPPMPAGPR